MAQKTSFTPAEQFVRYALDIGALELVPEGRPLKSKRLSPYFFNSGLFDTGDRMVKISTAYGNAIRFHFRSAEGTRFELLYGPPYKGTILVPSIAMNLDQHLLAMCTATRFCSSRKEAKEHGEGGTLIGSPIKPGDRVLIVDDVITDGGTKREAVEFIKQYGGELAGLVIAFDRQERGKGERSAVQEFEKEYEVPVCAVATLADLISVLEKTPAESGDDNVGEMLDKVLAYQKRYGVS